MQPIIHNELAAGVGNEVIANGMRGIAAGTAATAEVTTLVPAGAEEVSMMAVMAFATEGIQTMLVNTFAQEELARAGAGYVEASTIYETADTSIATTLI